MLLSTKISIQNLNLVFARIYKDMLSLHNYSNDPFRIIIQYLISLLPLRQAIGYNSEEFVSLVYLKEDKRNSCKDFITSLIPDGKKLYINQPLNNNYESCLSPIESQPSYCSIIPIRLVGCLNHSCQGYDAIVGNFLLINSRKIPANIFDQLQKHISAVFLQPSYRMKYLSNNQKHNCIYKNGKRERWGPLNKAGIFLIPKK